MTQMKYDEWVKTLERTSGRADLEMRSDFQGDPEHHEAVFSILDRWLPSRTFLSATDIEWLANRCLEWLREHAKAQTEWEERRK